MGGRPSKSFLDLPDNTKATKAKGVDEIILGLRTYGNIPGQDPVSDEESWLDVPEDAPAGEILPIPAALSPVSEKIQTGNELDKAEISPAHSKPSKQNVKKKGASVVVAHVESPQTLSSLR